MALVVVFPEPCRPTIRYTDGVWDALLSDASSPCPRMAIISSRTTLTT